jgi:hypothetical protein
MSSTASAAQSMQQKLEAENFLRRVQTDYPHLVSLGYSRIIAETVEGMKRLGIDSETLNQARFQAGLQNAIDTGALPKGPVQTVIVEAQPTPEQLEAQRLAAQEAERQRKFGKQQADALNSGRINHSDRQAVRASLKQSVKDTLMPVAQQQAKVLAEELKVYTPMGKVDWGKTKDLQGVFAHVGTTVDWVNTLALRKRMQDAADKSIRARHNNR